MARFALQDQNLFYGVYEADDLDMAIFHLLTHEPFCIRGLDYDRESKKFTYVCTWKGSRLLDGVEYIRCEASELLNTISWLKASSALVPDDEHVLMFCDSCFEIILSYTENSDFKVRTASDDGLSLWDHAHTIACPVRR